MWSRVWWVNDVVNSLQGCGRKFPSLKSLTTKIMISIYTEGGGSRMWFDVVGQGYGRKFPFLPFTSRVVGQGCGRKFPSLPFTSGVVGQRCGHIFPSLPFTSRVVGQGCGRKFPSLPFTSGGGGSTMWSQIPFPQKL